MLLMKYAFFASLGEINGIFIQKFESPPFILGKETSKRLPENPEYLRCDKCVTW